MVAVLDTTGFKAGMSIIHKMKTDRHMSLEIHM